MQPNKPVVLVVDDDPVNLDILVQTLEQDYFLIIAKNGKRALDLAFSHHPDLILLDILMPEMDGFEVCQRLKADKETESIPVIFLSVMESPGQKHRGFEVGGVDYVTKPFHADEVLARVRTHITNKRLREELESHNMLIGMELHEKSRQLETLMNNLPGLAYQGEHSPDRKVRFVSQGVTRLTGYTPEHFMGPDGMGLLALVHPDDRAHVSETLENALRKKEPFELTYRIITSWNEEKWVWEQGAGVHAGGAGEQAPLLVEGFINDVTEKQKQDNTIRQENKELRERLKARCSGDIVGNSPQITAVFDLIAKAAAVDDNVVVYGESGTGKELAARAIHDGSSRYQQPFVAVNCGAIPESLFESELFGYKKGAFTGATADKKGYLDQADGGTLFLDELGEISLMGQVKLLRAIEHGGFTPVGGAQIHRPDVRIIAATNRDLLERVNEGAMRRDFYYRIHVIPIHLPPLRERKADIPLLVEHFLKAYPSNKRFEYMDSEMLHAFMLYDWPGNVRELQNVLYQYLSLGTGAAGRYRHRRDHRTGGRFRSPGRFPDAGGSAFPFREGLPAERLEEEQLETRTDGGQPRYGQAYPVQENERFRPGKRITPARCNPRPDPSASPSKKGGAFPFEGRRKNVAFLSHFFVPSWGLNASKGRSIRSFYLNHGLLYEIFFSTMTGRVLPAQHLYIYHIGI